MAANANSIWLLDGLRTQGNEFGVSKIAPYVDSVSEPVVSDFRYAISGPGYAVSEVGYKFSERKEVVAYNRFPQVHNYCGRMIEVSTPNLISHIPGVDDVEYRANPALHFSEPGIVENVYDLSGLTQSNGWNSFQPSNANGYESLAAVSVSNPYNISGQFLENLHDAIDALDRIQAEQESALCALRAWAERQRTEFKTEPSARSIQIQFTFDHVLDLIELSQHTLCAPRYAYVLRFILYGESTQKLRQRIFRKIQIIKRALYQLESRFCAVSWSRRFWFLLHGSHPPKTEFWPLISQEFECA